MSIDIYIVYIPIYLHYIIHYRKRDADICANELFSRDERIEEAVVDGRNQFFCRVPTEIDTNSAVVESESGRGNEHTAQRPFRFRAVEIGKCVNRQQTDNNNKKMIIFTIDGCAHNSHSGSSHNNNAVHRRHSRIAYYFVIM